MRLSELRSNLLLAVVTTTIVLYGTDTVELTHCEADTYVKALAAV